MPAHGNVTKCVIFLENGLKLRGGGYASKESGLPTGSGYGFTFCGRKESVTMKSICILIILNIFLVIPSRADVAIYIYPKAELLNANFCNETWSSGTLDGRTSLEGEAVRYSITTAPNPSNATIIGDDWAVESTAGLAWDGGYLPGSPSAPHASAHSNVSIAAWDKIQMRIKYVSGQGNIQMRLFMHTGLCGASAYPPNDWTNDTGWQGPLKTLSLGETVLLELDFDNALVQFASNNKYPHSGAGESWADGSWHAVNERDRREVSNMGFEVYGPASAQIVLDVNVVPEPSAMVLLTTSLSILSLMMRKP